MNINKLIERIERKHGRVVKSNMTLAFWIHQSNIYIKQLKRDYDKNKDLINKIYRIKDECAAAMIQSGMNDIKINKRGKNSFYWLIVLSLDLEGFKYEIVVPYENLKGKVNIDELEKTKIKRDSIFINNKEFRINTFKKLDKDVYFIIENMKKSITKMYEKLGDI